MYYIRYQKSCNGNNSKIQVLVLKSSQFSGSISMYKLGIKINQADHYNAMHFIRVRWDCVLHISRYKKKMRDFCSDLNWWKSVSHQLISNLLLSSFFNLTPKDHWLNKENTSLPDCWSFFGKKLHNCISYWVNEQWFSNENI